jgi:F0F1-type ATP synthase membrane subunit a
MRQLVSVVALIAAIWVTSRFSSNLADYLRTALHLPEGIVTLVAILFLWIVTSNLVVLIGHIVFKRTRDQESPTAEWIYGLGGAFLGFLMACFFFGSS